MPHYVAHLLANGVRRDHIITAIGGGIIEDITCFWRHIVARYRLEILSNDTTSTG